MDGRNGWTYQLMELLLAALHDFVGVTLPGVFVHQVCDTQALSIRTLQICQAFAFVLDRRAFVRRRDMASNESWEQRVARLRHVHHDLIAPLVLGQIGS